MRIESCDEVALRSSQETMSLFKSSIRASFLRVFSYRHFTASALGCVDQAPNALFAQYYRLSFAIAIAILQLRKPASLCQSGAVAFLTIPLNRVYLESPTRRTMHFSPALV
jgi:hypothetical protein